MKLILAAVVLLFAVSAEAKCKANKRFSSDFASNIASFSNPAIITKDGKRLRLMPHQVVVGPSGIVVENPHNNLENSILYRKLQDSLGPYGTLPENAQPGINDKYRFLVGPSGIVRIPNYVTRKRRAAPDAELEDGELCL